MTREEKIRETLQRMRNKIVDINWVLDHLDLFLASGSITQEKMDGMAGRMNACLGELRKSIKGLRKAAKKGA